MNERVGIALKGIYRDILWDYRQRIVHDSGWVRNTIVTRFRVLLAGFVRNDAASGIVFLSVGQGDEGWDEDGAPPSPLDATHLLNPHSPAVDVADLELEYLDESDIVQSDPSPRVQVTATLPPGYPPALAGLSTYPLREFGLFGRLDGADIMLNSIRHPVIHKDESATLIRVVRLYF